MKQIVDVDQGSTAWHELRKTRFGGSDAAAMLGMDKNRTRDELLHEKATAIRSDSTQFQERIFENGHDTERRAIALIEQEFGVDLFPIVFTNDIDELPLIASLDGCPITEGLFFEHKQWNEALASALRDGLIPETHWPQLEHNLLVSEIQIARLVCSDGTSERRAWCHYESIPERRQRIIDGWKQFKADLDAYQIPEPTPQEPVGATMEHLPALRIEVEGKVLATNLDEFRTHALSIIGGINRDLKTDQDFADAETAVKWLKTVEKRLDQSKDHALSQTQTIDQLFRTLDQIREEARKTRLALEKDVKDKKVERKNEIVREAQERYATFCAALHMQYQIPKWVLVPVVTELTHYRDAIHGLKSIQSIQSAVNDELARQKIATRQTFELIAANLVLHESIIGDQYRSLFPDISQLIQKTEFEALAKLRILEHEQAQTRAAQAKAETEAKAREARVKAEQEEDARRVAQSETIKNIVDQKPPISETQQPLPLPDETQTFYALHKAPDLKMIAAFVEFKQCSPRTATQVTKIVMEWETYRLEHAEGKQP